MKTTFTAEKTSEKIAVIDYVESTHRGIVADSGLRVTAVCGRRCGGALRYPWQLIETPGWRKWYSAEVNSTVPFSLGSEEFVREWEEKFQRVWTAGDLK